MAETSFAALWTPGRRLPARFVQVKGVVHCTPTLLALEDAEEHRSLLGKKAPHLRFRVESGCCASAVQGPARVPASEYERTHADQMLTYLTMRQVSTSLSTEPSSASTWKSFNEPGSLGLRPAPKHQAVEWTRHWLPHRRLWSTRSGKPRGSNQTRLPTVTDRSRSLPPGGQLRSGRLPRLLLQAARQRQGEGSGRTRVAERPAARLDNNRRTCE